MTRLQPEDVAAWLAATPGARLLDVREDWEVQLAAIRLPDAPTLHIPMQQIPQRLTELAAEQPLLCVCHHGMRSAHVAAFLERAGFDAVSNLEGGIDAWADRIDPGVPRY